MILGISRDFLLLNMFDFIKSGEPFMANVWASKEKYISCLSKISGFMCSKCESTVQIYCSFLDWSSQERYRCVYRSYNQMLSILSISPWLKSQNNQFYSFWFCYVQCMCFSFTNKKKNRDMLQKQAQGSCIVNTRLIRFWSELLIKMYFLCVFRDM